MNNKAGIAVGNQSPDTFLISRLVFNQTFLLRKCKHFSNVSLQILLVSWSRGHVSKEGSLNQEYKWLDKDLQHGRREGKLTSAPASVGRVPYPTIQPELHWEQLREPSRGSGNVCCLTECCFQNVQPADLLYSLLIGVKYADFLSRFVHDSEFHMSLRTGVLRLHPRNTVGRDLSRTASSPLLRAPCYRLKSTYFSQIFSDLDHF